MDERKYQENLKHSIERIRRAIEPEMDMAFNRWSKLDPATRESFKEWCKKKDHEQKRKDFPS